MQSSTNDYTKITDDCNKAVSTIIYQVKKSSESAVLALDKSLIVDLYCDSLDMAEIKLLVQKTYPQSSDMPLFHIKTV